jgi:CubicO group peptidase (beta-lactamase class C family)
MHCCVVILYISLLGARPLVGQTPLPPSAVAVVPEPAYWPTEKWKLSSPEQQGVDSRRLADAIENIHKKGWPIHSLLVIRNGYVILDATFFPYDGSSPHDIASCTKSVTVTLVGAAIQDKKIRSLDAPVLEYFADRHLRQVDERKDRMRIADLLTMRSGLQCEYKGGEPTLQAMRSTDDWTQFMLDLPMAQEPGQTFTYCSGAMHLLSALVSRVAGMTTLEYAKARLFAPLGITRFLWPADPQGVNHGWGDLHLLPRDLAKLGLLYLQGGLWDGRRILPAEFVAAATTPATGTPFGDDYGYGWWISPTQHQNEFMAIGRGGQRLTVLRKYNAIIVVTGGGLWDAGKVNPLLARAVVSDRPLAESPGGSARLAEAIRTATADPAAAHLMAPGPVPQGAPTLSGVVYRVRPNPLGLEAMNLDLHPLQATVSLAFRDGRRERHDVGIDGVYRVSEGGYLGLPVALRGQWESNEVFVLEYNSVANIDTYILRLRFKDSDLTIEAEEVSRGAKLVLQGQRSDSGF